MDYLQYKWREYFAFLDVNHDRILDTTDVDLAFNNSMKSGNLTEREVFCYNVLYTGMPL